jgi:non-ribosomal peptide synthetase component F
VVAGVAGQFDGGVTDRIWVVPLRLAHPAYVILTSGSTGRPKVWWSVSGFCEFVCVPVRTMQIGPGSQVGQLAFAEF